MATVGIDSAPGTTKDVLLSTAGSSISSSALVTVGASGLSNYALLGILILEQQTVTAQAMTWNGTSMTLLGTFNSSDGRMQVNFFGLTNPATGANSLSATWATSTSRAILSAISFNGALQTGGTTTFYGGTSSGGTSASASVSITSAVGDYCVDAVGARKTNTANQPGTPTQSQIFADTFGSTVGEGGASSSAVGAATVSFGWTLPSATLVWVDAAIAIKAAAGVVSNVTVSEAATGADSVIGVALYPVALTEAATASDSFTGRPVYAVAIAEAVTAVDSSSVLAVFAPVLAEAASAADNVTVLAKFVAAVVEAVVATDTEDTPGSTYNTAVTEAASASDSPSAVGTFLASLSEAMIATDAPSALASFVATLAEAVTATDTTSGAWVTLAAITEAATATDTPAATLTFFAALTEAAAASDSVAFAYFANAILNEAATATDSPSAVMTALAAINEVANAIDTVDGNFPIDTAASILKTLVLHPAFLTNR